MSTKAFIQNLIDTNLANDSNILPSEHRAVEDALLTEQFPSAVKVEWNGTTSIDPTADIVCFAFESDDVKFKIYFWKQGNTVYFNGVLESLNFSSTLPTVVLVSFETPLYDPLPSSFIKVETIGTYGNVGGGNFVGKQKIGLKDSFLYITSGISPATNPPLYWEFNGTYKVAN